MKQRNALKVFEDYASETIVRQHCPICGIDFNDIGIGVDCVVEAINHIESHTEKERIKAGCLVRNKKRWSK